jgi:hypothetical protein
MKRLTDCNTAGFITHPRKILMALALAVMPLVAAEKWQDPVFIRDAFNEVALKNEYADHDGRVRKWQQPIRIWLDHQVTDTELHTRLVSLHISDLARITGHRLTLVDSPDMANVTVTFTSFEKMQSQVRQMLGSEAERVLQGALCLANISTDSHQRIHRARVIIPVDQARMHGKLVSCVVEELTQIMGLVNDSERAYPSVFNDRTPDDLLSGLDYVLLKILYDQRILPGMSGQQARATARMIAQEMQKSGEIEKAWSRVSGGELYRMLGY